MSSTLESSVFMGKNYSDNWHSIKNTKDLTMKQMFDISAKLVSEQDEIYGGKQLTGKTLHGNTCLWLVMNKSSFSSAQESTYSQILYCVLVRWTRTLNQILHGKTDWRGSKFTRIQRFGQNWWWANGTRVEHFPKIHHFATQPQTPRAVVMIDRNTREFDKKDHLHVYVQRHLMRVKRQQDGMRVKCSTRFSLCKEIRSKTMIIPRT